MVQGMAKGLKEGMAKGQTGKALEIAHKMKDLGLPFAQIAELTGLSLEDIEGL